MIEVKKMKIALSGFEGVGKTYLTEEFQKSGFFKVKESARSLIHLKSIGVMDKNEFSMSALPNNLKSLEIVFDKDIDHVVFDGSILDDLIYLDISSNIIQNIIDDFNDKNNINYIYDKIVLLQHSKDDLHIKDNILSNKDEIYNKAVEQYKEESQIWEEKFLEMYGKVKGLAKKIKLINSYPENKRALKEILEDV